MGVKQSAKQWIQRKQKHYKLATGDYLARLCKYTQKHTEQKLQQLNSRSLTVRIESSEKLIIGIIVNEADLPDARSGERVILVPCAETTGRQSVGGRIVEATLMGVKIKLERPLSLENIPEDKREYKIKFDNHEIIERKIRIEKALHRFKQMSCSLPIHKCLLGNYKDWSNTKYGKARVVSIDELASPKGLQVQAVKESMKKRISLIEGAAGSGKTLVAANIACSMVRVRKRKILLCSPIQATVDKMAKMLRNAEGISVVQLPRRTRTRPLRGSHVSGLSEPSSSKEEPSCELDRLVDEAIYKRGWDRSKISSVVETRRQRIMLHKQGTRMVANSSAWLRGTMEKQLIARADIVCCTLVQAGSRCLKKINFDMLIIDDAQVATEVDCMIPMMVRGIKQVTLLSDVRREIRLARSTSKSKPGHKPSMKSLGNSIGNRTHIRTNKNAQAKRRIASRAHFDETQGIGNLFERWLSIGLSSVALKYQYRMHETLAAFSNYHFYLSGLKNDSLTNEMLTSQLTNDLLMSDRFTWLPKSNCLTALFATQENEINATVGEIIEKLVAQESIDHSRIVIITTTLQSSSNESFGDVEVGTVEDFFGQERDFVILACSNRESRPGASDIDCNYVQNDTALNIALTRARLGLFIVADLKNVHGENCQSGSSSLCCQTKTTGCCKSWRDLVKYYLANKLVI